jgi:DNA-binding HxlR family transcriptional regulator
MVKRTSFENAECPIARSLDALGDWWSLLIIRDAMMGIRRFSEFQKNLGCAKNILAVRLRALVDQDILKTAPASDGSAYQEYLLTPKGRGVFPVLIALRQWSEEFAFSSGQCTMTVVDRENCAPRTAASSAPAIPRCGPIRAVNGSGGSRPNQIRGVTTDSACRATAPVPPLPSAPS